MPLRHRLEAHPESIQDLALASEERYWEGVELLVAGRPGAGVYLLGFVVEMILKNACFLLDGARPSDLVQPRLGPIRSWAKRLVPGIDCERYHSVWFWAHVLRKKRRLKDRRWSAAFEAGFLQRVHRVYGIWTVNMRYKPDEALPREAESLYRDATWIRDQQVRLVI